MQKEYTLWGKRPLMSSGSSKAAKSTQVRQCELEVAELLQLYVKSQTYMKW